MEYKRFVREVAYGEKVDLFVVCITRKVVNI